MEKKDVIESAIHWLLNSKIHNTDKNDTQTFGSFNNYYDIGKKNCQYAYTEITAYGVELLLDMYKKTKDAVYLESVKAAGDWIINMQYQGNDENCNGGYFHCIYLADHQRASEAYPFDAGIILGALSGLYLATNDSRYLDSATLGSQWLIKTMQNSNGSFKPLYDLNKGAFLVSDPNIMKKLRNVWYHLSGCHHGKIMIGLLKYYAIAKDPSVLRAVTLLSDWIITQQTQSGYFRTVINSDVTFSHTHSYATEGLLFASDALQDLALFKSAKQGGDWLIQIQKADGSIPAWTNDDQLVKYVDISAVAQAVGIWSVLLSKTADEKYRTSINKSLKYLCDLQNINSNAYTSGGFYLAELDLKIAKHKINRLYSWPTMFAIHALNLSSDLSTRKISGTEMW